jgi:multimeric flavodoxin WrbA
MKIITVVGSPRLESSGAAVAANLVKSLGGGHEAETFVLNDLKIRGCQGCESCKTKTEICVITDDILKILSKVADADFLILTSPIYMGEITGQAKLFVDRTYSFYKPDFIAHSQPSRLKPGKKALLLYTQGNPDPKAYEGKGCGGYKAYFESHGFSVMSLHLVMPHDPAGAKKAVEDYSKDLSGKLKDFLGISR